MVRFLMLTYKRRKTPRKREIRFHSSLTSHPIYVPLVFCIAYMYLFWGHFCQILLHVMAFLRTVFSA